MRESEKDPQRLRDIIEAIDNVFKYVGDCDFNSFLDDAMRYHAVVYNIMVIGEAANLLTKNFCIEHPATPWRQIIGMRNFLIHGYKQVEKDLVWQVIDKELNILREQVKEYLNELDVLHNTFIKE